VSADFNDLFMIHSAILAVLFMISYSSLHSGTREHTPGH
jgi:hypothetical protein